MSNHPIVVQRCLATGLWVAHVPDIAGAHSQAESLDELRENLSEVLALIEANDGESVNERSLTTDP